MKQRKYSIFRNALQQLNNDDHNSAFQFNSFPQVFIARLNIGGRQTHIYISIIAFAFYYNNRIFLFWRRLYTLIWLRMLCGRIYGWLLTQRISYGVVLSSILLLLS